MLNSNNQTDFLDGVDEPMTIEKYYEKLTTEVENKEGLIHKWVDLFNATVMPESDDGDLNQFHLLTEEGHGYACDGFALTDHGSTLILLTALFKESENYQNSTLKTSDIMSLQKRAIQFFEECKKPNFGRLDDAKIHRLALEILKKNVDDITNIKIYIISNGALSHRATETKLTQTADNLDVYLQTYALEDFFAFEEKGEDKKRIIYLKEQPLPFLEGSDTPEITTYLTKISGQKLAELYKSYGMKLLESNVRAFLGKKGENKGIRLTLEKEKHHFFAYNNGLTATAKAIKFNDKETRIVEIEDLQIVNGGQTTVSIFEFKKAHPDVDLSQMFVSMKLNVLKKEKNSEKQIDVIANIARYSNTQNKIKESDLGSNHEYFKMLYDLSERIKAPSKLGAIQGTYWHYERLRGSYEQSIDLKQKHKKDYPKNQKFEKEMLSKIYVIFNTDKVYLALQGATKTYNYFAELWLGSKKKDEKNTWQSHKESVNETHFQNIVAQLIIYQTVEELVTEQAKSRTGKAPGQRKNPLTAYIIAVIIALLKKESLAIDYTKVWQRQSLSEHFKKTICSTEARILDLFKKEEENEDLTALNVAKKSSFLADIVAKLSAANLLSTEFKNECKPYTPEELVEPKLSPEEQLNIKLSLFYKELEAWLAEANNQTDWLSYNSLYLKGHTNYKNLPDNHKQLFLTPYRRIDDKKIKPPTFDEIEIIFGILNRFIVDGVPLPETLAQIVTSA
jgi:hypothetical protein